jgi:hypothetical protein
MERIEPDLSLGSLRSPSAEPAEAERTVAAHRVERIKQVLWVLWLTAAVVVWLVLGWYFLKIFWGQA